MDKEINEVVETVTNEVRTFNEETITPIKERLASLEERGTSASDEKVTDLEKQLNEAEARSHEKLEALQEEIRLAQAAPFVAAEEKNVDPFKGAFFRNLDEARGGLLGGETRAVNTTAIASAGKMNADQASAFLDYVVGDNPTLSVIEKRMMSGPTADLDRISVDARKLIAATEGDNASLDTDGINFTKKTLTTTEAIWAEDLTLSFLEDNIAGGNAESQVAAVVGKAIGEELNDLAWNGDGATGTFLAINTGFEDLFDADTDTNEVDGSGETTAKGVLKLTYKTMPSQYRTLSGQTIFASPGLATLYMDEVAGRATALGDSALVGGMSGLSYFGVPIVVDRHLGAAQCYMSPRDNMVFGVQRDITSESEWNPRRRRIELTVSLRFDYQIKFGGVVVRTHSLASAVQ